MSATETCTIILNWNLKDETVRCTQSVLQNRHVATRVIIIDNNSQDGSVAAFRNEFGDRVEIIVNEANYGYAAGMNIGIQYALGRNECEYFLLLNNDTILSRDMIYNLLKVITSDPQIAIVAPMILYFDDKTRIWNLGDRRYRWLPFPLSVKKNSIDKGDLQTPFDVDYVTGCGMLIKRTIFERVGLFDPIYLMYGEDADFCRRVREAGYRIVSVPAAKMWHKVSLSSNKDKPRNRFLQVKSQTIFYRRHRHGPHPWLTHLYVMLKGLSMGLHDIIRGDFKLIAPLIHGLWAGYREPL